MFWSTEFVAGVKLFSVKGCDLNKHIVPVRSLSIFGFAEV